MKKGRTMNQIEAGKPITFEIASYIFGVATIEITPQRDGLNDSWYVIISNSLTNEIIEADLNVDTDEELYDKLKQISSTIRRNAEEDFSEMMNVVER